MAPIAAVSSSRVQKTILPSRPAEQGIRDASFLTSARVGSYAGRLTPDREAGGSHLAAISRRGELDWSARIVGAEVVDAAD